MQNKSDISELRELLVKASEICSANMFSVDNIDLHSMMETFDNYIDELNAAENPEIYDEADMEAQDWDVFGENKI